MGREPMTDLDEKFGPCRPAGREIEPHELARSPLSLIEATEENSYLISEYLNTEPRFKLTSIFAKTFYVLWVMNRDRRIFLAIEEIIDAEGRQIGALPRAIAARPNEVIKLGHPSLLDDGPREARIGGEIIYDPGWSAQSDWVLTNKSGRYGLRPWQTEEHLRQVQGLLASWGLTLSFRYSKPLNSLERRL